MAPLRPTWMVTIGMAVLSLAAEGADSAADEACSGFEEVWSVCNEEPCDVCKPRDCTWNDWTSWGDMGGCIGLASRARAVKEENNHCGKPCVGNKFETKEHLTEAYKKNCILKPINCEWSEWNEWTGCRTMMEQSFQERAFLKQPKDGGKPCTGSVRKTRPCVNITLDKGALDCQFSDWAKWTDCSRSCDGGHKTRTRRVVNETKYGGVGCSGSIDETSPCGTDACGSTKDCVFSEWQDWDDMACLSGTMGAQRYRGRDIKAPATGAGDPCVGQVKEAAGCEHEAKAENCKFEDWQAWGHCTATCGGGQQYRNRNLKSLAQNGGTCFASDLQETQGCKNKECPQHCHYETWSDWASCTPKCGQGITTRERKVSGYDCKGATKVVKNCTTSCQKQDCKWSDWDKWSACTLTCGGGTHLRNRRVTDQPRNGGKECAELTTQEIGACNEDKCGPECVDGTWSEWSKWSDCSVTCQSGYQTRTRQVESTPNHCGKPAAGLTVDVKKCTSDTECVKSADCKLSNWTSWTDCNRDCFGVQEKSRQILQYAQGFYGKPCNDAVLKIIQPCNPGKNQTTPSACRIGPKSLDCELGKWSDWSTCSQDCGPGQTHRVRGITQFPESDGKACNDALKETDACKVKDCAKPTCVDCKWGDWGEWGQCMGKCEGQTYRHRNIAQLANWCGANCTLESSVETKDCKGTCLEKMFCTWSEWDTTAKCDENACGPQTRHERRSLKIEKDKPNVTALTTGTKYQTCHGTDNKIQACPFKSCDPDPVDCKWGDWEDWGAATCAQLCERSRDVKTMNAHGGKPCTGDIRATKACKKDCEVAVDCEISKWTAWSDCASSNAQTYRTRNIDKRARFGGAVCTGNLEETRWCTEVKAPVDCKLSEWDKWSKCTATCDGGTHSRKRSIATEVAHGGKPCTDALGQVQSCNDDPCKFAGEKKDCELSDWSQWNGDPATLQKTRDRSIKQQPEYGGRACNGTLEEIMPIDPIDCKLDDWGPWDTCDRPCENGQQQRQRKVDAHPHFGGKACPYPLSLLEARGCEGNSSTCDADAHADAHVSTWDDWSPCTASCGAGQNTRSRKLTRDRGALGVGFTGELKETRQCTDVKACEGVDCKWHDWSMWSACTKICGGGEQTRNRAIAVAPQHRGKACAAETGAEIQPCNIESCDKEKCTDAEWADWSEWGACSASCLGGVQYKHRTIAKQANSCGKPAVGNEREYKACNALKPCATANCTMSEWEDWGTCTSSCDGVTRRQRSITQLGSGTGTYCEGALNMLKTCNPSTETSGCKAMVMKDCEWGEWSDTNCSAKCGRGDFYKKRDIKVHATFGGKPCDGNFTEVHECKDLKPCPTPKPINCEWDVWSKWSACTKCGGQRKKYRNIKTAPQNGGTECKDTDTSLTEGCLGKEWCDTTYCAWTDWDAWGGCSRKCGSGTKMRRRNLKEFANNTDTTTTTEKPTEKPDTNSSSDTKSSSDEESSSDEKSSSDDGKSSSHSNSSDDADSKNARLYHEYQELEMQLKAKAGSHWQELVMSFAGGCISFVVLASAVRFGTTRMRCSNSQEMPTGFESDEEALGADMLWSQRSQRNGQGYSSMPVHEQDALE